MKQKLPRKEPWQPAEYELADVMAVKAIASGTATDEQQKRMLKWLVETVCCTYDLSYRPISERDTVFAEGKRFVGLQIVKALHLNVQLLGREDK